MQPNDTGTATPAKQPTLSELLLRSLEDDGMIVEMSAEGERYDADEGSFGG